MPSQDVVDIVLFKLFLLQQFSSFWERVQFWHSPVFWGVESFIWGASKAIIRGSLKKDRSLGGRLQTVGKETNKIHFTFKWMQNIVKLCLRDYSQRAFSKTLVCVHKGGGILSPNLWIISIQNGLFMKILIHKFKLVIFISQAIWMSWEKRKTKHFFCSILF